MNVVILDEARLDIADGVAFYDRQSDGAGDSLIGHCFLPDKLTGELG